MTSTVEKDSAYVPLRGTLAKDFNIIIRVVLNLELAADQQEAPALWRVTFYGFEEEIDPDEEGPGEMEAIPLFTLLFYPTKSMFMEAPDPEDFEETVDGATYQMTVGGPWVEVNNPESIGYTEIPAGNSGRNVVLIQIFNNDLYIAANPEDENMNREEYPMMIASPPDIAAIQAVGVSAKEPYNSLVVTTERPRPVSIYVWAGIISVVSVISSVVASVIKKSNR